jgi:hypothetical protein
MGRASRLLVVQRYGVEKIVSAYLEALAQLATEARVKVIDVSKTLQIS